MYIWGLVASVELIKKENTKLRWKNKRRNEIMEDKH